MFKSKLNNYIDELRKGRFSNPDFENGLVEMGIAILEYDWLDIELNLCSKWLPEQKYSDEIMPSYFCCVKGVRDDGSADWSDAGYLDDFGYEVDVDWNAENVADCLEKDMEKKLAAFAEQFGLSYSTPNWQGDKNDFSVFDRIHELGGHYEM